MTNTKPVTAPHRHTTAVHTACEALWVNYVQSIHEVRATSSSMSIYGALYSPINPLINTYKPKVVDVGKDYVADGINAMSMHGYGQHPQG